MPTCRLRARGRLIESRYIVKHLSLAPDRAASDPEGGVVFSLEQQRTLGDQIHHAVSFLVTHLEELQGLGRLPGVEALTLDFSAPRAIEATFPAELVALAGSVGIGLALSGEPDAHSTLADPPA